MIEPFVDEPADSTGPTLERALSASSPEAAARVKEHVEDNDEVLSTILLGDLGRWFWESVQHQRTDAPAAEQAAQVLGDLFAEGDDEMETVIATGFLEALPQPADAGRDVVERLPQVLREELRRMEAWRPPT